MEVKNSCLKSFLFIYCLNFVNKVGYENEISIKVILILIVVVVVLLIIEIKNSI